MHGFLSCTMAASLFIHAVLGCCWHHAHCDVKSGGDATASQPPKCCQHHHPCDNQQPQKPCKCNLDCEGTCTYVAPQKVQIDAPQMVAPLDLVAIISTLSDAQVVTAARWELASGAIEIEPPLQLHFLNQTLLI